MEKQLTPKEILEQQISIFKNARYSGESSYWDLQSLISDLQALASSFKIGNLHMYGAEFAAYYKWLGDKRSLKSGKKFKEIKERVLYDLSTVRIINT